MVFKLGSNYTPYKAVPPVNQGASGIAQKRLNNIVSRAVAKHENAMLVDANPIYIWARMPNGSGGPICSCQQNHATTSMGANLPVPNTGNRNPKYGLPDVSSDGDDEDGQFQVIHVRGNNTSNPPNFSNKVLKQFPEITDNNENDEEKLGDQFEETEAPMGVQTNAYDPNEIARYLGDTGGGGLFGGDATACGICYATTRVNGYQIINGGRIILETSDLWPFSMQGAVTLNTERYPSVFKINGGGSVVWTVDLPTYVEHWMTIGILNNNKIAYGLIIEAFWNNAWVLLNSDWLKSTDGQNRSNLQVRVRPNPAYNNPDISFTHAELRYMNGEPTLAQCPQIDFPVDYEVEEVLVTTEFEVLASLDSFPRESYFQDSKFRFMWKVTSVSVKSTALNQVYAYEVQVRRVTTQELQYTMHMLPGQNDEYGFKGLEYVQGDVQNETFPNTSKPLTDFVYDNFHTGNQDDRY